ncbi:MAG: type II secretion system protein N, partial [Candidatus Omnitrophota bacterium]
VCSSDLIFMAGYTAYSLWDMTTGIRKASNLILNPDRSVAEPKEPEIRLQDVAFYLEKIRSRNIFNAAPPEAKPERKKEDGEPVTDEKPLQAQDDEATKNFSLVGIAWSDDPEAMIEDKAASRTLFVRRGQSLPNGVRVVTIFKEKIILSYKGKEFELS